MLAEFPGLPLCDTQSVLTKRFRPVASQICGLVRHLRRRCYLCRSRALLTGHTQTRPLPSLAGWPQTSNATVLESPVVQTRPDPAEVLPTPRQPGLAPDDRSFLEEHRIRSYEVGPDQRTTIVTIANLLQVCAAVLWC